MPEAQKKRPAMSVPGAPAIPGLRFRGFRGEADYPPMADVIASGLEADQAEWAPSPDAQAARSVRPDAQSGAPSGPWLPVGGAAKGVGCRSHEGE